MLMKRSMKKVIMAFPAIVLLVVFFVCIRSGSFKQEDEPERFAYPSDFSDCLVAEQKKAKCRIPEEILSEMTVEELVWAVIDYPFLFDVGLSSYSPGGSGALLATESDAFARLIECDASEDKIIKILKAAQETEGAEASRISAARFVFYDSQGIYFDFNKEQLKFLNGD